MIKFFEEGKMIWHNSEEIVNARDFCDLVEKDCLNGTALEMKRYSIENDVDEYRFGVVTNPQQDNLGYIGLALTRWVVDDDGTEITEFCFFPDEQAIIYIIYMEITFFKEFVSELLQQEKKRWQF